MRVLAVAAAGGTLVAAVLFAVFRVMDAMAVTMVHLGDL